MGLPFGPLGLPAITFPLSLQGGKNPITFAFGSWNPGDAPGTPESFDSVPHGPNLPATELQYQTRSEREAFAIYTQSVYTFNEHFALTAGVRWARDQLNGEENLFDYIEDPFIFAATTSTQLVNMNILNGAMDANGRVLNYNQLRTAGVPASESLWRQLYRKDDAFTYRVNLDWTPNDKDLIYFSVTSGYRAGRFQLGVLQREREVPAGKPHCVRAGVQG